MFYIVIYVYIQEICRDLCYICNIHVHCMPLTHYKACMCNGHCIGKLLCIGLILCFRPKPLVQGGLNP